MRRIGDTTSERVLVIGLDGATYDVLTPLAAQCLLPNLATLMRRAALARLQSTDPFITPAAWSTFQTGADPQSHGIFDYRYLDHQQGELRLNNAARLKAPTMFDVVSRSGGQVVSLNLPVTYPAACDIRGVIIGGLDSPGLGAALAPYPKFAEKLRASGARYDLKTIWKRKPESLEELQSGVAETIDVFRGRVTAAKLADAMNAWRLMVVQFQTLDSLQHRCWHLLGLEELTAAPGRWVRETQRALTALDSCVGELLELADRRGAAVLVVSDHGFGSFREKICVPRLLVQNGLTRLSGGAGLVRQKLTRGLWRVRKWQLRRKRPGESTASLARPLEMLAPIDWRRSAAVALHGDLAAMVYLNSRRRFARGALTTPREVENAEAEVIAALSEARHPQTGEPLFVRVDSLREKFNQDPVQQMWPDVLAIPADGFQTRAKLDGGGSLMQGDAMLTGTHRAEGVLMIDAPGAASGRAHQADLRDVAPTILHHLGEKIPSTMTGSILSSMWQETIQPAKPPARWSEATVREAAITHQEQDKVEARLRELGYLD